MMSMHAVVEHQMVAASSRPSTCHHPCPTLHPVPPVLFPPDAHVLGCSDHSARKAQRAALGTTGVPQAAQSGAACGILVPCGGKVPVKGEEGLNAL